MPKKEKYKKLKEKTLEELEKKSLDVQNEKLKENNLTEQIKKAAESLYYVSETDAEILPYVGEPAEAVTKEKLLSQTKSASDAPVEERDFAGFFIRLTEIQDWFGDEEKEMAQKFTGLRQILENNLRDLKVFKVGKIQLDIYVVGLDAENKLTGIRTKAIET